MDEKIENSSKESNDDSILDLDLNPDRVVYYPNSSAAFNMELIGDLTFKLNPGPSVNRTIPVIVSSQAKRSHALRPATVLYNATLGSKNCCPRGVNWHNLISIRCSKQKLQNGFVPIDFCLLNTRSINKKELAIKD